MCAVTFLVQPTLHSFEAKLSHQNVYRREYKSDLRANDIQPPTNFSQCAQNLA